MQKLISYAKFYAKMSVSNYVRNQPYLGHSDGTPERTENTGTQNKESTVSEELVSGSTKEQQGVGRSLFERIMVRH